MKLLQYLLPLAIALRTCSTQFLQSRSEFSEYDDDALNSQDSDVEMYEWLDIRDALDEFLDADSDHALSGRAQKATSKTPIQKATAKTPVQKTSLNVDPKLLSKMHGLSCKTKKRRTKRSTLEARTPPAPPSDLLFHGEAYNVQMGHNAFQPFQNGHRQAIGTSALCGCFAIIIAAPRGAIVAHVNPGGSLVIDQQLAALWNTYSYYHAYLQNARTVVMVSTGQDHATGEAGVDAASIVAGQYLVGQLANFGLSAWLSTYHVDDPPDREPQDRGTAIVISEANGVVSSYVNDQHV